MRSQLSEQAGQAVRKLRLAKGWTLAQLGEKSGVPLSTLSKLELGQVSLSYDKLMRLCRALDVDLERFVRSEAESSLPAAGRRSVVRAGAGEPVSLGVHRGQVAAADLLSKTFTPIEIEVAAVSLAEHGPFQTLRGDAYLRVLDGAVALHSGVYAPLKLASGDAVYFDGRMEHAILTTGPAPAHVLLVVEGNGPGDV